MKDKLSDLIKVVFDNLESLEESEFKKNLAVHYEDPLTEILSYATRPVAGCCQLPYVFFHKNIDYNQIYEASIAGVIDNYNSIHFDAVIQQLEESTTYVSVYIGGWTDLINVKGVSNNATEKPSRVNKIIVADDWNIQDQDYLWQIAA